MREEPRAQRSAIRYSHAGEARSMGIPFPRGRGRGYGPAWTPHCSDVPVRTAADANSAAGPNASRRPLRGTTGQHAVPPGGRRVSTCCGGLVEAPQRVVMPAQVLARVPQELVHADDLLRRLSIGRQHGHVVFGINARERRGDRSNSVRLKRANRMLEDRPWLLAICGVDLIAARHASRIAAGNSASICAAVSSSGRGDQSSAHAERAQAIEHLDRRAALSKFLGVSRASCCVAVHDTRLAGAIRNSYAPAARSSPPTRRCWRSRVPVRSPRRLERYTRVAVACALHRHAPQLRRGRHEESDLRNAREPIGAAANGRLSRVLRSDLIKAYIRIRSHARCCDGSVRPRHHTASSRRFPQKRAMQAGGPCTVSRWPAMSSRK